MAANTLHTERLRLRPFVEADAADYARQVFSNPAVMRYMNVVGSVPPSPLAYAMQVIGRREAEWAVRGYGAWAVTNRADGALMGHAGLYHIDGTAVIEIGYALGEAYWGQGYATEAARAVLCFAFTRAALPRIVAVAFPQNIASLRVMQKIGMRYTGLTTQYYNLELASYALTHAEYHAANPVSPGSG